MKDRIVFIGAGVGNMTAVIELLQNGYPGELITIIEQGTDLNNRDLRDVLSSSPGSSAVSDNKIIFSEFLDKPMNQFLGLDKVREYYKKYQDLVTKFHPNPKLIDVYEPKETDMKALCNISNKQEWKNDLKAMNSLVWHVGSKMGVLSGINIEKYIRSKGVNFKVKTEVIDVDFDKKIVYTNPRGFVQKYSDKTEYSYDKLVIAPGKSAKRFFTSIWEKVGIKAIKDNYEVGVRFEIPYNEDVQKVIDETSYDFKFTKIYPNGDKIRTFCACSLSAYIKSETFTLTDKNGKTYKYVGPNGIGHGTSDEFKDLFTYTTNFGIIVNKKTTEDIITKIIENLNRKTVMYEGRDCNFKSAYEDYDKVTRITFEEFLKAYGDVGIYIKDMIEQIKPIFKFGENYRFIGLEFKDSAPTFLPNLNKDMSVKGHENVFCYGDILGGGVVGITPAILGAYRFTESILKN